MSLDLILDCREHKLIEIFPDTKTEQLDIGDILYVNSENHSEIKCIVERKTLNDLSSSIIDGRYKEQKCRLLSSGIKVVYILEGMSKNKYGVKFSTLLSAMLNMQFRDNITVIRTKDVEETSQILIMLKDKIKNIQNDNQIRQITYESSVCLSKKLNMTKDTVFIKQLSCIPGVSDKIAKDIANIFPTMKDLIIHYNTLENDKDKECLLTTIDGIGIIISRKIYNFLY